MKEYNIIGDIAGNYETLLNLLSLMPSGAIPLSVGDMVDRGPRSKAVLEFFMQEGREALLGNHEHMMLSTLKHDNYYSDGFWYSNGGTQTVKSFYPHDYRSSKNLDYHCLDEVRVSFLNDYATVLEWLESLPKYTILPGSDDISAFVSHAPWKTGLTIEQASTLGDSIHSRFGLRNYLWNREIPERRPGYYMISGHNSHWGLSPFTDEQGEYGKCIDSSANKVLTGIHWPSLEVFQVESVG